jgi:hypothetical protein
MRGAYHTYPEWWCSVKGGVPHVAAADAMNLPPLTRPSGVG